MKLSAEKDFVALFHLHAWYTGHIVSCSESNAMQSLYVAFNVCVTLQLPLMFINFVCSPNSHKMLHWQLTKVTSFQLHIYCLNFPSMAGLTELKHLRLFSTVDDLYLPQICSELALSGPITAQLSLNWKHFQTDLQVKTV